MVDNIGRGFTTMMFSYQKAKHTLLFTIIAIGAITAVGIASTVDIDANESTNNGIPYFGESGSNIPLKTDEGGGMPSSFGSLFKTDEGGGMPS